MFSYHCLNPIAEVGLDQFTTDYKKVDTPEEAEAILVRSAAMHEMTFSNRLETIARAGAGEQYSTGALRKRRYCCF